jgi:hypothetical protein
VQVVNAAKGAIDAIFAGIANAARSLADILVGALTFDGEQLSRGFRSLANAASNAVEESMGAMRRAVRDGKMYVEQDLRDMIVEMGNIAQGAENIWDGLGFGDGATRSSAGQPTGRTRTGTLATALDAGDGDRDAIRKAERQRDLLTASLDRLRETLDDPNALAISSLQRVGGGGIAADVNRDATIRIGQQQLRELQRINESLSNQQSNPLQMQP